ncbi:MAG: Ig domain-containing protein [Desulfuromonadales bacterium]
MIDKSLRELFGCWVLLALLLTACSEDRPVPQTPAPPTPADTSPAAEAGGDVKIQILPGQPTAADCLGAVTTGISGQSQYRWYVNEQLIPGQNESRLCGEFYKRGDQVAVAIGKDVSTVKVSVTIANSPPKITGISATPEQVFADSNIKVVPVAEDKDGDPVEFRYQWLVNGEANPFLTEDTLAGDHFNKGDVLQIKITPFDGFEEGPVYESFTMTIPNAPPLIDSQPPQQFEALEYSYQVKASDADGDRLVYTLAKSPQGMTIDPGTGLISWPLTGVNPAAYPLKIVVSDPDGAEAFQEFTLTLGAPK